MQNFWHLFRCLREVPPKLYGRYDGWPGLGWDFSSTRQHLCHRHAGSSPEEVFSVFEKPIDRIVWAHIVTNISQVILLNVQLSIPGQSRGHRLLVLPDRIHLCSSFFGETRKHILRRSSLFFPGCLLRCPHHSVFHFLCRDSRGTTTQVGSRISPPCITFLT